MPLIQRQLTIVIAPSNRVTACRVLKKRYRPKHIGKTIYALDGLTTPKSTCFVPLSKAYWEKNALDGLISPNPTCFVPPRNFAVQVAHKPWQQCLIWEPIITLYIRNNRKGHIHSIMNDSCNGKNCQATSHWHCKWDVKLVVMGMGLGCNIPIALLDQHWVWGDK